MYSNTAAPEAGSRVVVRCVPLLGPPYLRKGSRICGKTVGRSCLFVLITFGVASLMIGVVLFTADLQMVTGFWAVGIVLFTVGFLMVFSFIVLCCVARRTYNSLPANHPQRSKQFRPSTTLPAHTSSYQLLPMRQPVSYISPPGMQTVDSYPLAHGGQAVAYSTLRGGGGIGGGATAAAAGGGAPLSSSPSPSAPSPKGGGHHIVGYSSLRGGQRSFGGEPYGYSTLPGGHGLGYPTIPRGPNPPYHTSFGRNYPGYSTTPTRQVVGYQTPPRQYSVCFPIPTIGEADQSSTTLLLSREGSNTPTHPSLVYSGDDNPPPYSSLMDHS